MEYKGITVPDEKDIEAIVKNCAYTEEADKVVEADGFGVEAKVNIADATVFYGMGYHQAIKDVKDKCEHEELLKYCYATQINN